MSAGRLLLAVVGTAVAAYGGFLLAGEDREQIVSALVWLIGGALVHDLLLVPVTLVLVALLGRLLPTSWRAPAGLAFVVLATVTVVAIPFLGRFGALPDNPTLLDRDYTTGYLVLVGVVLGVVVAGALVRSARRRTGPEDLSASLDDTPSDTPSDTPRP
ncbi:hypothetical protein [Nocardioides sp. CFH 31398]|uniref:hypothetical protein n=1 Tax=Nocardioides sp. CFH 31398 TaxID=2919579 RepID=UPI001F05ECE9|nr:hypothetical protein [Nocardioides sp. CFH 31398]MCH1867503.1 hypothetical protein [Nocardioides sp. CFH 31398]